MMKKLHNQSFKVVQQLQHDSRNRYLIMILKKKDQLYFYKQLNHDGGSRFKSQIDFQKKVKNSGAEITLPRLYDYELTSKTKWGLWEYLKGHHLADWRPKRIQGFAKWLEPIVNVLLEMEKIRPSKEEFNIPDHLIKRVEQWAEEPIKQGFYALAVKQKVIDTIKKNRQKIIVGFNHSDFVPWHMHEIEFPKFAIVDYENSKNKPKYYDLAYFYHRVYTKLGEPKLANQFLKIFKKKTKLPGDFNDRFLPVLGERIIGGIFDCVVNKDRTDIELHNKLLRKFISII